MSDLFQMLHGVQNIIKFSFDKNEHCLNHITRLKYKYIVRFVSAFFLQIFFIFIPCTVNNLKNNNNVPTLVHPYSWESATIITLQIDLHSFVAHMSVITCVMYIINNII